MVHRDSLRYLVARQVVVGRYCDLQLELRPQTQSVSFARMMLSRIRVGHEIS
jgi:hypothetical protein